MEKEGGPAGRLMGNWKLGFVCAAGAFALILAALFGQWYDVSGEETYDGAYSASWEMDFGLREFSYFLDVHGETEEDETIAYSDYDPEDWEAVDAFGTTQILVVLAIIFALLLVISALLIGMGRVRYKTGVAIGVLAVFFALLTLAYSSAVFPNALGSQGPGTAPSFSPESGFWGSGTYVLETEAGDFVDETTWGPGWAWYAMLAAFVLALIGTISLIRAESAKTREPNSVQTIRWL